MYFVSILIALAFFAFGYFGDININFNGLTFNDENKFARGLAAVVLLPLAGLIIAFVAALLAVIATLLLSPILVLFI